MGDIFLHKFRDKLRCKSIDKDQEGFDKTEGFGVEIGQVAEAGNLENGFE